MGILPADCYDDDGNVIEDCMERLRAEERWHPAEDGTKFRSLGERDEHNRYLHKEGQRHMREESAKRDKRSRLNPYDTGFDDHRTWGGGGATPYPKNKKPPTAPAGVAMRKKRAGY